MATTILADKLYLGDLYNAKNRDLLDKLKIKCIINVAKECNYKHDGITIHKFDIDDIIYDTIYDKFDSVVSLIKSSIDNNENVLVHCYMGKSRSVSFILAYLMKHNNMNLHDAHQYVTSLRKINPNAKFMEELVQYEYDIYGKTSFSLNNFKIRYISRCFNLKQSFVSTIYRKHGGDLVKLMKFFSELKKN